MTARRGKRTGKRTLMEEIAELPHRLSGVPDAVFTFCADCGSMLSPIIVKVGDQAEICCVACIPCQTSAEVLLGVVMAEPIIKEIDP